VRKSREETLNTRKRIVEVAAEELRAKGIDGAGVADIMSAAGLTQGGFYRHFSSKDQLVAEACDVASKTLSDALRAHSQGKPPHKARQDVISCYLSTSHRDNLSIGCPFAALGGELARADANIREVATEGFLRLTNILAEQAHGSESSRRSEALAATSAMIGALMMARVIKDETLSQEVLQAARDALCR
jgi:TetR/AcrR family transcriptional repressor of nem operon